MKKLLRRGLTLLLCVLLLVSAVPAAQGATVYFVAINNTLLPLSSATMPFVTNGILYVPYTVLSMATTGVNMEVYATHNTILSRVVVYSGQKQLIFDLQTDIAYDMDGHVYSARAITRGSTVYIPIAMVCQVFQELQLTVNSTEHGQLVRIKNNKTSLDDPAFINAAATMMKSARAKFEAENPTEPEESDPPAAPSVPPTPMGSGAAVYLAFAPGAGNVEELLTALGNQDCKGLFFLTADRLAAEGDLARRLLGGGHFIGLYTPAENLETALSELEAAQSALTAAAHCKSWVVLAEGLTGEDREALAERGYVLWESTADGREGNGSTGSRAKALMKKMTGGESARNYLLLDDLDGHLNAVLVRLREEEYHFRTPLPTEV